MINTKETKLENYTIISKIILFILFISFFMSVFNFGYTELGRFKSFLLSPTVFTVFLDALFIIYLYLYSKNKFSIFFLFLVLFYFHIESGTRLNLLFLFLIFPIYHFIRYKSNFFKIIILLIYILSLNFLYPAYEYFTLKNESNILASRYTDNRDASFGLRLSLFNTMVDTYLSSSVNEKVFGNGSEYTRRIIIKKYGQDLLGHNDFLRLIIDFGFISLVLYMFFIIRLALKNNLTYLLVMLYLLSFYHNMIYSYYLISLIIITSFSQKYQFKKHHRRKKENNVRYT
jgi:hypothetical protein